MSVKLRNRLVYWLVLCSALVGAVRFLPARAQQGSEKLYSEDFEDGVAQNWNTRLNGAQGWVVDGGRLYGSDGAAAIFEQAVWDDTVYSFRFNPGDMQGNLRALFRASQAGRYALDVFRLGDTLYMSLVLERAGQEAATLDRWEGVAGEADLSCRIVQQQGRIQVYLNSGGAFLAAAVDTPELDAKVAEPLPVGTIGFAVLPASFAWVDDLLILGPLESATYFVSGRVYDTRKNPLAGVSLDLYGAPKPGLKGNSSRMLDRSITDGGGSFRLKASLDYELRFYGIHHPRQVCCAPLDSRPATGGYRVAVDWLEYETPLWEHELDGNVFVDERLITPTPSETLPATPVLAAILTAQAGPTTTPRSTPTVTPASSETPVPQATARERAAATPEPERRAVWPWVAGLAALILIGGSLGGFIWLLRALGKPPPAPEPQAPRQVSEEPQEPEPPDQPFAPVIPPLRLLRVWITQGRAENRRRLTDREALSVGQDYRVHVQVPAVVAPRPGSAAGGEAPAHLAIVIFVPQDDFEIDHTPATLRVPPLDASSEIQRKFVPLHSGKVQMRICAYYGGLLVQSVVVEADVVAAGEPMEGGRVERQIDYVADATLSQMTQMQRPTLSIFTNRAVDGSHWIGVYSAASSGDPVLSSGFMQTFSETELRERGRELRELFSLLQGGRPYRYQDALPLDSQKLARSENDLVRLALAGWKVFHSLFLARSGEVDYDRLPASLRPGLISVARCRGESPTLPWAALYELRLDTGQAGSLHLCPVFKEQLAANVWSPDGKSLVQRHDLLDHPRACRELVDCPLKGPERLRTVCPFGFWGMVHQIEQPVQLVTPTPVDQLPPELSQAGDPQRTGQTAFLVRRAEDHLRLAVGVYPGIPDASLHLQELQSAGPAGMLDFTAAQERNQVLEMLEKGDQHLYYFYCHGVIRGQEFRLLFGPAGQEQYLSAADLDPRETHWQGALRPLVILNGCETMRLTPELIHGLLGVLRQLGASGVVGTEMPVVTLLARPVGVQLVHGLSTSFSIGECFLQIRHNLLRQGNPLGLAYSFYASASLHLHDPQGCAWCQRLRSQAS